MTRSSFILFEIYKILNSTNEWNELRINCCIIVSLVCGIDFGRTEKLLHFIENISHALLFIIR